MNFVVVMPEQRLPPENAEKRIEGGKSAVVKTNALQPESVSLPLTNDYRSNPCVLLAGCKT